MPALIEELELEMRQAAKMLEFEKAASLRDQILTVKRFMEAHEVTT
jgi:excinuclease UvrABC nuclease subunit